MASTLERTPSNRSARGNSAMRSMYIVSRRIILLSILIPFPINNVKPRTIARSARLLPMTFPKLMTGVLLRAAFIPTNNSGSVVVNARIRKPPRNSLTFKTLKKCVILLTAHMLPLLRTNTKKVKNIISVRNAIILFSPQIL